MKKMLPFFLLFIVTAGSSAQGVVNNGAFIVVGVGAYVNITGTGAAFVNNTSGTDGSVDNEGTVLLQGNWTNNAANGVFINANSTGTVVFNGTSAQTIGGTGSTVFENLEIGNASGVSMQQSQSAVNSVILTSGALTLNTNTLTVNNAAAGAISRTSGYIVSEQTDNSGRITWNISSSSGAHVFPFATPEGAYIPLTLDLTAGDIGQVTVSTYSTPDDNTPYPATVTAVNNTAGTDNSANTVNRFWQVDKNGTSGTATLTFTATVSEVGSIGSLVAQRWNADTNGWDAALPGQSATSTSVTVPGVTSFSPWALSGNSSQLPIELLSFEAVANEDRVNLQWITATETNNDYFTVEKTADGVTYETVAVVKGAGTTSQSTGYTVDDNDPYRGLSYYRLKQTDFDGKYEYTDMIAVEFTGSRNPDLRLYPNPCSGTSVGLSISVAKEEESRVEIRDASGRIMHTSLLALLNGQNTYTLYPAGPLPPGIYLVKLAVGQNSILRKLVVN